MGWDWLHLARWPPFGLLYQLRNVDECGAVGGMRIGRGSRSTRRKPATLSATNPTLHHLGLNLGRRGWNPSTDGLSYGTAKLIDPLGLRGRKAVHSSCSFGGFLAWLTFSFLKMAEVRSSGTFNLYWNTPLTLSRRCVLHKFAQSQPIILCEVRLPSRQIIHRLKM
jgi:hypothetical protein